jgi:predicted dithiol-disulfide oxidoreductase (DUF899 family)
MAVMTETMSWPNETDEYRSARDVLLQAEIELRRQEEAVAAMRRALPSGGEVTADYVFDSPSGQMSFAELFATGKDTLYLYNFMFISGEQGLPLEVACPSCTSIIDAMDGAFRHLLDRVDVAVVAKAPIEQFAAWGSDRGWRFTPLYSSSHTTFSELLRAQPEPGQHPRHVDYMWPIWKVLDLTPDGRGTDWYPRYLYA